jgi:ankyrin repeat protein
MAEPSPTRPISHREAREALSGAVRSNDAAAVAGVIERHPELGSLLDDALVPDHSFGATALIEAVKLRNRDMVEVLLAAGADINARSHWWAGSFGVLDFGTDLAPFLIDRGAFVDINAAARLGMFDRVRDLLAADPELVHARGGDGQTPLHVAATVQIAELLLERGADIDALDVDHESTAAQYHVRDRQDIARLLVARGARTDILLVSALGDVDRVRRHLDADPDAIWTDVSERSFPKANPRSGGTIYTWTLGGDKTAHLVAREFGHEAVFDLLMRRSPPALQLTVAAEAGDEDLCSSILAAHPDGVAALDPRGRSRIVGAARNEKRRAVQLLAAAGWPIDARGQHGGTALHWAAWHGNTPMVADLLERGAPTTIADHDFGGTPLGWAIHGSEHGWRSATGDYAGTVEALLRAGATPPADIGGSEAVRAALLRHRSSGRERPS